MGCDEYPEPDALDERWFVADSEQWAEVVRLLDRAPEPKPQLATLLRERGMFASQSPASPSNLVDELRRAGEQARERPAHTKRRLPPVTEHHE